MMRRSSPLVILVVCLSASLAAAQARGDAADSPPPISACSLLSAELMLKVGGIHKDMVKYLEPTEEPVGAAGSACDYASVRLQVNPFGKGTKPRQPAPEWQAVTGVGDGAFFRPNGRQYAELIVWTGANHFTIQFGVPTGATPESIRPNTIELAHAIVPKLR